MLPHYMPGMGKLWLERGGVFVLANIRGGGEFGPSWHKAGMRERKRLAQDDFAAVARDLIRRGVTRPGLIAIEGQCNGGLLTANMMTRHPDLFGAVIADLPVLDMRRYSKLLNGHDWIAEYGDPDNPEDWAFMRTFSPYHLAEAGRDYPPALFTTTRRDDRTHPAHARKMTAKLQALGHDALLYEPEEGGHGSGADTDQSAFTLALKMAFIRWALGLRVDFDKRRCGGLRNRWRQGIERALINRQRGPSLSSSVDMNVPWQMAPCFRTPYRSIRMPSQYNKHRKESDEISNGDVPAMP